MLLVKLLGWTRLDRSSKASVLLLPLPYDRYIIAWLRMKTCSPCELISPPGSQLPFRLAARGCHHRLSRRVASCLRRRPTSPKRKRRRRGSMPWLPKVGRQRRSRNSAIEDKPGGCATHVVAAVDIVSLEISHAKLYHQNRQRALLPYSGAAVGRQHAGVEDGDRQRRHDRGGSSFVR